MKKIFFIILFLFTFNSIHSIAKYSNTIQYNFLAINILVAEISNNTLFASPNTSPSFKNNYYYKPNKSHNANINSDIFIDTNTNIQIQITK